MNGITRYAMSRRRALGLGASIAAGAAVAGCHSGTSNTPSATKKLVVPALQKPKVLPGAITSADDLVPMAYEKFPTSYVSVPHEPGSGGDISVFMLIWGTAPPKVSKNQWWQQLDKNLNAKWRPIFVPSSSYEQKVATMLASGNIPDICWIQPDQNAPTAQAVQQGAFTNLTDALSGDAVKDYPNLAQIPTYVWERSAVGGSIFGVPQPLYLLDQVDVYRADWAEKLGYPKPPKNADEVLELFTAFSKGHPAGGRQTWGIAAFDQLVTTFVGNMFHVPNMWRLNKDGTFTYYIETDEYETALTYMNKMWKAGVFHPDALLYQTQTDKIPDLFTSGRTGFYRPAAASWFGSGSVQDTLLQAHPEARPELLVTPGHDGGLPMNQQTNGWWGITSISADAGKDKKRLAELLRVLDYWAAPFGSAEYDFINYGIEGRQFKYNDAGDPAPVDNETLLSEMGGNYFISPAETVLYYPGTHGRARIAHDFYAKQLEHSVANPALGLLSQTFIGKNATLAQLNTSYENDIVAGRKPLSALKEWRSRWASQGGGKIKQEYQDAYERSHGKGK